MTRTNGWTVTAAALLLLTGCREIEVTTEIYPDGSLDRQVVVSSDSEGEMDTAYPLLDDAEWEEESREVEAEGETRWTTTYRRSFPDVRALGEVLRPDPSERFAIRPEVELKRRFRWFTTLYAWREYVPKVTPYDAIPLEERFTRAEIDSFLDEGGGEELRERFEAWQVRNFVEDLVRRAAERVRNEGLVGWDAGELHDRSSALFDTVMAREDEIDLDDLTPAILDAMKDVYDRDATVLEPAVRVWEEELMAYLEGTRDLGAESYTFRVRMPGLLVETGADEVKGSTATWDLDPDRLHYADFEMTALSRVTNTWALWVTGAVVLLLLLAAAVSRFRRPASF